MSKQQSDGSEARNAAMIAEFNIKMREHQLEVLERYGQ